MLSPNPSPNPGLIWLVARGGRGWLARAHSMCGWGR